MPRGHALLSREGKVRLTFFFNTTNAHNLGFNADVIIKLIDRTLLNPAITLPILLLSHLTPLGRSITTDYEVSLRRLKILFYLGLARWVNGILNQRVLDNWESSRYEWEKEIAVVTGGSDGIGKHISLLLAEQGVKVAVLDVQPLTFEPRMLHYLRFFLISQLHS